MNASVRALFSMLAALLCCSAGCSARPALPPDQPPADFVGQSQWTQQPHNILYLPPLPLPGHAPAAPPISFVRRDGAWTLYSAQVNRVFCVLHDRDGSVWLGTGLGIKHLDKHGHLLRLYAGQDGLTGDAISAIAVDAHNVWCVAIDDTQGRRFALCHLDRARERWETLREIPIPFVACTDQTGAMDFVDAGSPRFVCFSLGAVARSSVGTALFVYDRTRRVWQDVPWDSGERLARNPCFPFPEPVGLRAAGRTVWVASSNGLHQYDDAARVWTAPSGSPNFGPPLPADALPPAPGWWSKAATLPVTTAMPGYGPPPTLDDDFDAAHPCVWSTDNNGALIRTPSGDGTPERFGSPVQTAGATPPIASVAVLGTTLYALTEDTLWQRALPDGVWTGRPLPSEISAGRQSGTVFAADGHLWVQANGLFRCDGAEGRFTPISTADPGLPSRFLKLLGEDNNSIWLTGSPYGQALYRLSANDDAPVPVPVPIPANFQPKPYLVGVAAGKAWFAQAHEGQQYGETRILGCDLRSHDWTAPMALTGDIERLSLRATSEAVFFSLGDRMTGPSQHTSGDVYRYNLSAQKWGNAAPPPPPSPSEYAPISADILRLVSVDARSIWLADTTKTALCRWDRNARTWTWLRPDASLQARTPDDDGSAAVGNGAFFVASTDGLWRCADPSGWTRLLLPGSAAHLRPRLCAADTHAVWALASDPASLGQTFAARFDKQTHQWRLWGTAEGFPEHDEPMDIATDGSGALASTYRPGVLALSPDGSRWASVTTGVASNGKPLTFPYHAPMASDPAASTVWMAVDGFLLRWNRQRQAFDPLALPPFTASGPMQFRGDGLLADARAVWWLNDTGLWRWDKRTQTATVLTPPPNYPSSSALQLEWLTPGRDGAVWLAGRGSALRYAPPAP